MSSPNRTSDILDALCPMHLTMGADAVICHVGPTLLKMRPEGQILGRTFWDVFAVRRPKTVTDTAGLLAHAGKKLHLRLRSTPESEFKAVLVPTETEPFVINLSFSVSIAEVVQHYALTSADFPPTDLTIDMLYLIEAQSAAMHASRKLTQRLQGAKIAAEEQAFTDTLTGLKNRRAMDYVLDRLRGWNAPFAVMNLDLDFFKQVNDTLGHAAGDHVLQKMAQVLVSETRENDVAIRLGGDEFALILPHMTDAATLAAIAQRIIATLSEPIPFQGEVCRVSASVGSAIFDPKSGTPMGEVLEHADIALYASKRAGRSRYTAYTPELSVADPQVDAAT